MVSVMDISIKKEPFARDACGKVYEAKWRDKDVAVKIIKTQNPEETETFTKETNITFTLNHQNVIRLFGITYAKRSQLGIVMELAEHGSLDKWIGKIDREKLTPIALGIVDGLEYVHSRKVIHRDVKPKNILMFGPKDAMTPKLAYFGVSKVMERVVTVQTSVGTGFYMAPEVCAKCPSDEKADIFSMSVVLFEMFNGQLIDQSSPQLRKFMVKVQNGTVGIFPESSEVPRSLFEVIRHGWSENPSIRPSLATYRSTLQGNIVPVTAERRNYIGGLITKT